MDALYERKARTGIAPGAGFERHLRSERVSTGARHTTTQRIEQTGGQPGPRMNIIELTT